MGARSLILAMLGLALGSNGQDLSLLGCPYPQSDVIQSVTFCWDTYTHAASGSDLWPVTWGPDGHLYAAWGDGGGFGGSDSEGRVSMGFARIEGGPTNYVGINVNGGKDPEHPASFAKKGKTAGLAFVNGILYATINLQDGVWPDVNHVLAWSANLGATWERADWMFPKGKGNFQPAKFLNFGKNYTKLPRGLSGYVYLYGPQQEPSPQNIYLCRVPGNQLRNRKAYEYFHGRDLKNNPAWTSDFKLTQPVFSDTNGVTPTSVVYVPRIKRFLLTSYHTGPGQLGIFDSSYPWGPWTTIAYYEDWGGMTAQGEGLSCEFPQKWISPDGLSLWSIFSVYGEGGKQGIRAHDRFNLIKVTLTLAPHYH